MKNNPLDQVSDKQSIVENTCIDVYMGKIHRFTYFCESMYIWQSSYICQLTKCACLLCYMSFHWFTKLACYPINRALSYLSGDASFDYGNPVSSEHVVGQSWTV